MLSKIHISKFRSCEDVRLEDLHEILVLIGRNGAGKTNILKAIEWACRSAYTGVEKNSPRRATGTEDGHVALTFTADGFSYRYEIIRTTTMKIVDGVPESSNRLEEKIYVCDNGANHLVVHRNGERVILSDPSNTDPTNAEPKKIEISGTIPCLLAISAFFPEDSYFKRLSTSVLGFMSSVIYYPLHNFDEVVEQRFLVGQAFQKWKSEKIKDANSITSVQYKILDLYLNRRDTFDELVSLMGPDGLGLVKGIEVIEHSFLDANADLNGGEKQSNTFYWVAYEQPRLERTLALTINDLSFGTKRILFLLVAMLYDRASVALVEQPEDGVHVGLVDKLVELFRVYSENAQFVIASHSTTILNSAHPNEIYFISNAAGITSARTLTQHELAEADEFLRKEGPLSEFLELIGSN